MTNARATVPLGRFARGLGAIASLLVLTHLMGQTEAYTSAVRGVDRADLLFDLAAEGNVPTLFATAMFLINALLMGAVRKAARSAGDPTLVWSLLAALFCFLAVDESLFLHERLVVPLRTALGTSGVLHFAWVIPYGIGTLLVSAGVSPTLWRMPRTPRLWFVLSACTFVAGAIGFEMIAGYIVSSWTPASPAYHASIICEESLEMAGLILCAHALLTLLRCYGVDVVPARRRKPEARWPDVWRGLAETAGVSTATAGNDRFERAPGSREPGCTTMARPRPES